MKSIILYGSCLLLLILAGCSDKFEPELNIQVDSFELTNQHNETVSSDDLKGTPWLAMFVYTRCKTVCPPMTTNMVDVHQAIENKEIENYKIVGFSVDPEYDTPEVLNQYLSYFPIEDDSKWEMLTGYEPSEMTQFAHRSFNTIAKKMIGSDEVMHDVKFFLVDQNGTVVKSYNGYSDVPVDEIVSDLKLLQ